jgi:hypothetical protein
VEIKRQIAKGKKAALSFCFAFGCQDGFEPSERKWLCFRIDFCLLPFAICLLI